MKRKPLSNLLVFFMLGYLLIASGAIAASQVAITTGTLLEEMWNLDRLARWPDPQYRTVQFSSFDRRSTTSEQPSWFSNADGFGREPIPGFQEVLREPSGDQPGLYLVAEVRGPGAIVRGWSAGMGGVLRVYLDPPANNAGVGEATLIWQGPAYDFLARRSGHFLKKAEVAVDATNAFTQEDADYFPIPFARGLRVTWEGKLNELHFYHLQVRLYGRETVVRTFDPAKDLKEFQTQLEGAVVNLTQPTNSVPGQKFVFAGTAEPSRSWSWFATNGGPAAVRELRLRARAQNLEKALRGCLLRISFDGSQRAQVESPVGDFFASGPGVNPFSSLPISVSEDGTMTCRFVMPYEKMARIEMLNYTASPVEIEGSVSIAPWQWNERSLYFRAKWRVDHDLLAGVGVIDLPYTVTIGKGVFAGCAAMIMNPSGIPTAGGNWWGEGDEKILVDGETVPSTFGTGSEDYFNYSWSRSHLFGHPYCGQPLDSGPDTAGYVSNHRFQVLDAIPFERSLGAYLELWAHNRTPGMSYARIAYYYARPGAIDDHRGLMPSDLRIVPLPKRELQALGGARGARFLLPSQLQPEAVSGRLETVPFPLATQLELLLWHSQPGDKLKLRVPVEKTGRLGIRLVALHRPDGATVKASLEGVSLSAGEADGRVRLRSSHAPRVLNVHFKPVEVQPGTRELLLECVEPGVVGLDYLWVKEE